jgi:heat shock protein HtpX
MAMLRNWLKTSILMAGIMALFAVIGAYLGGSSGMLLALLFGGAMNFFAYWFSDTMVLKMFDILPALNDDGDSYC